MIRTVFDDLTEAIATLILAFTGVLLAAALILEHAWAMDPCPLCLMQRVWFALAGLTSLVALLHSTRWGIYPLLTMLAALVGGGFAIRQLYLQSLPPDQVPACGPDVTYLLENFPLAEVLAAMTRGTGDCAEVDLLLGVTLPAWALVGFVGILLLSGVWLRVTATHR